jgi:polar amino acid transport system substrate-binding protein
VPKRAAGLAVLVALAQLPGGAADARALAQIKDSGAIVLCAHPNSLPFASKDGSRHGFQVELAQALARRLGVSLTQNWVITSYDIFRADCDIVMDSIADRQAQAESGLRISKPYRRSGVALAMRGDDKTIRSLDDLTTAHRKVGVLTSSIAAMKLSQGGAELVPGLFEDEMLAMLASGEIDAAAVTPTSAGYYNLTHPKQKVRLIYPFEGETDLSWNVAVGMRRPDPELQQAIDDAMTRLLADGTVKRIYARYGVAVRPPR